MRELSLFSGIGGIYGSLILGWETAAYVEKDEYCQAVIRQRIADGWFHQGNIYGDIAEFNRHHAAEYAGTIDVLTGRFPCQPFSPAGKRKGTDDDRYLFAEIVKTIEAVQPRICFFENVPGLLTSPAVIEIYRTLGRLGYLSAIFNYAREQGWTSKENPCRNVKKHSKKRREVYIEDYLYQAVYQAASQQMRDLMDIAYITGQRPVDIVGIHSSHIHEGILHISQQKTGAKLRFEISGKLKEIIDRIHQDNGYLFLNSYGKPLTRDSLGRQFLELRKTVMQQRPELAEELSNFQVRDLRAKAATDIYLSADTRSASNQLGHASEQMTKTYIRRGKILKPLK